MNQIVIDLSRYLEHNHYPPAEAHLASWTFIIGGRPTTIFGPYSEAAAMAKLYLRMTGHGSNRIVLEECASLGRNRTGA